MMTLAQAQAMVPGAALVGDGALALARVHTDSRSLRAGDLFVALRGERFDGHDFLGAARQAGAAAAIAERGLAEAALPGLLVGDSLRALQDLAAAWRQRMTDLPLIAVTGSNGKTTVTQMLANILRAWHGDAALATEGNFNNHIGLPLTVLRLRQDDRHRHRAAVLELGMNHPGEIALLARIAAPTVVLVNNAQREHQEFMVSVEAVARENGSAIDALPAAGVVVFPADDAMAAVWRAQAGARTQLTFATRGAANVTADAAWAGDHWALRAHTPGGDADISLHVAGAHNVHNALAAATAALAAGAPMAAIVQGLQRFRPVSGRSRLLSWSRGGQRVTLVDDSYNANPDSVRAAIDLLMGLPGPHWLLLGDMGEVGTHGPQFHTEVGVYAKERGVEQLWLAGAACRDTARAYGAGARHFAGTPELIAALSEAPGCASALVKGSRFMGMERVVRALVPQEGPSHAH
jgi:UDP-N-acetylmuramoyl-tripeptide--D-alanyl-D-alanine ligase